jgi:hypothetical protein
VGWARLQSYDLFLPHSSFLIDIDSFFIDSGLQDTE